MDFKNVIGVVSKISYTIPPVLLYILEDKKETHKIFCKDRDIFHNKLIKFSVFKADYQHNFIKDTKFMHYSCAIGAISCVAFALFLGSDIHDYALFGAVLSTAAYHGHDSICKILLKHGAFIHAHDNGALRWAVYKGHVSICSLLLEHGANVHARNDDSLRSAAYYGHFSICELLLKHGANANACNNEALRSAKKKGHEDVCKLLNKYMK